MKNLKLQTRLQLLILSSVFLVFAITIAFIAIRSNKESVKSAKELAHIKANEAAKEVEKYVNDAVISTQRIAETFIALKEQNFTDRNIYNSIILKEIKNNENFLAVWIMFEPNSLDGNDANFKETEIFDANGSFNLSYYRDKGNIRVEKGDTSNYEEDYYKLAKIKGKNIILEPYFYSYTDNKNDEFFETSICIPIHYQNQVIGVAGIDINLSKLQELNKKIKVYKHGYGQLISSEGLIMAHPDETLIGKNINDNTKDKSIDLLSEIKKRESVNIESKEMNNKIITIYVPVKINSIDNTWYYGISVPVSEMLASSIKMTFLIIFLSILGLLILTLLIIVIAKNITNPILKSIEGVKELSKGNLDFSLKSDRTDELGDLQLAIKSLREKLVEMIGGIKDSANYIASASSQISASSQLLAQSSNEQASSVEEVSSTMEEIASNISSNTENARLTEIMSSEANTGINEVAKRAKKSVDANKTIMEKISIINDIAFQTNILALNAAVEAARAGEHGKGFAVVASEVRKLAERSKVAADEIVKLAKESFELASGAGAVMLETMPKVEKTTKLIQEISASSLEQNGGVEQVNNAIQQLNGVTQQNASSSEQLSTNAEELAAQAEQMKEIISFFKFNDNEIGIDKRLNIQNNNSINNSLKKDFPIKKINGKKSILIEMNDDYMNF